MSDADWVSLVRIAFFLLAGTATLLLWLAPAQPGSPKSSLQGLTYAGIVCLLAGVFAYQATWQLAGFTRPSFMTFLRRYNPRPVNAGRTVLRGTILDRNGLTLAMTRTQDVLRVYPLGPATSHLLGYADPKFGLAGIESELNAYLLGQTTETPEEAEKFRRNLLDHSRIQGNRLKLTIDAELQRRAYELLEGRPGAVAAMDVRNGDILALVSSPGFAPGALRPDLFSGNVPGSPMLNRVLSGVYPPGSTFKILIMLAALESGFTGTLDCPASGFVPAAGMRPIRDHEYYDHQREGKVWEGQGAIPLNKGFRRSSNVFFAQLGVRVGAERIESLIGRCGFTNAVEVRLSADTALRSRLNNIPDLETDKPGPVAQVSIGQGALVVTPMHMLMLTAAVAADGAPPRPRLQAMLPIERHAAWFSPRTATAARELMREAVMRGTGKAADIEGLEVAGKTGTAQNPAGDDHAWFACFAPLRAPRIALVVLVENSGYGATVAVPIAAHLLVKAHERGLTGPLPGAAAPSGAEHPAATGMAARGTSP